MEPGLLSKHATVSESALPVHASAIATPSHNSFMPLDLTKLTAVPSTNRDSESDFQSGQKRSRIDSEQCDPNEPSDRPQKCVRLTEQPNTLTSPTTATGSANLNATPITKNKETAPRGPGAKRGRKSKAGVSRPKPSAQVGANSDSKKEKKKPAAKSSKPPPPPLAPRQASKRYAASWYLYLSYILIIY